MRHFPFPGLLRKHPRGLALLVGCCFALLVTACDSGMGDLTGSTTGTTVGTGTGTTSPTTPERPASRRAVEAAARL